MRRKNPSENPSPAKITSNNRSGGDLESGQQSTKKNETSIAVVQAGADCLSGSDHAVHQYQKDDDDDDGKKAHKHSITSACSTLDDDNNTVGPPLYPCLHGVAFLMVCIATGGFGIFYYFLYLVFTDLANNIYPITSWGSVFAFAYTVGCMVASMWRAFFRHNYWYAIGFPIVFFACLYIFATGLLDG